MQSETPQVIKDFIEEADKRVASQSKKKKLSGKQLRERRNLERLKGIVDGTKMRKNEFIISPLEMVYDHIKCSSCLEPATHVETMSLDENYKRHLCKQCVEKGK